MTLLGRLIHRGQPNEADVVRLTVEAAARLRVPFVSRFTSEHLARRVEAHSDLAFGVRDTQSYGVGGVWRRREDIGEILEISRGPNRRPLLRRLIEAFVERGVCLVVLDFEESASGGGFYADEGFSTVDRIIEYEHRLGSLKLATPVAAVRPYRTDDFSSVLEIDHDSFPWLWRNSPAELAAYVEMPDVEIFLSLDGDAPVGYAGLTVRGSFAHLDRLAVRAGYQRRGHGATLLSHVLAFQGANGVQRIALSTQEDNHRSRTLYERYGFTRGRWSHEIRGLWLKEPTDS